MAKYKWEKEPESRQEAMNLLELFFKDYDALSASMTQAGYFRTLNGLLHNAYARTYSPIGEGFDHIIPKESRVSASHQEITSLIERVRRANKDNGMPLISHEMSSIIECLTKLRELMFSGDSSGYRTRTIQLCIALEKDNHKYQGSRPCTTCSDISSHLGIAFGCNRKAAEIEYKGRNPGSVK